MPWSPGKLTSLVFVLSFLVSGWAAEAPPERVWRVGVESGEGVITGLDAEGNPTGFGPALMFALGQEMGIRIEWVVKPWHLLLEDIRHGRIDVLSLMAYTPERDTFIDFSSSVLELRPGAFGRKGATHPRDIHSLKGFRLAVQRASFFEDYLRSIGTEGEFVYANSVGDRLAAVTEGRADIAFVSFGLRNAAVDVVNNNEQRGLEPLDLTFPGMNYRLHYGVPEGAKQRLALLNEGLARLRDNGTHADVYEKWIGPLQRRQLRFRDLWRTTLTFVVVAALGIAFAIWQRRLMLRLKVRTTALRESEEKLKLVLEAGDHGYWQTDYSEGTAERSPRAIDLLGYGNRIVPSTPEAEWERIHPEDRALALQAQSDALATGRRSYVYECRVQREDGEWRWIQVKGRVLEVSAAGTARRAAGTITDITEAKRAQAEREEVQRKVLEAQRLEGVGLLAGGVAHDFNNLLTVIIGSIGLARLDLPARSSLNRHLDQIEAAARRAGNMCRQLLASAGRATIQFEAVDLNAAVTDTLQLIKPSIPTGVEVALELHAHLPAIEADSTQVRQIIMNLVLNAAEAIGGVKGTIILQTVRAVPGRTASEDIVMAPRAPEAEHVCLTISDTGSGMSPEVKQRIFEPFFTTKFTGRGLGLAATIGLVRTFGGGLHLTTAVGRGTTFRLFFPLSTRQVVAAPLAAPAELPPPPPKVEGRARILVVDDEPAVLAVAASVLSSAGYTIVRARDAGEALQQFRAEPEAFDAALLDLTMPDKDGATLLIELREIRPQLRALMMSGFSAEHVMARLPRDNPPGLLRKPFDGDELILAIQDLLATRG